ncbi:Hypothetical protein NocV09_02900080 [Nannochloropsis oceanica]
MMLLMPIKVKASVVLDTKHPERKESGAGSSSRRRSFDSSSFWLRSNASTNRCAMKPAYRIRWTTEKSTQI